MKIRTAFLTAVLLATTVSAGAQPAPADPHHPPTETPAPAAPATPTAPPAPQTSPMGGAGNGPATQTPMQGVAQVCMDMMGMMQAMQTNMMEMMMRMMMGGMPAGTGPGSHAGQAGGPAGMTPGMPGGAGDPAAMALGGGIAIGNMTPANQRYMAAMNAMEGPMMEAMYVEDPDFAFVMGMIAHHQAAIDMARALLEFGQDERTRRWAEAIIAAQQGEIDEMRAWMAERGMGRTP